MNPFDLLGVQRDATRADVWAARRRLAKITHPDLGGDAASMQRVNEAAAAAIAEIDRREAAGTAPRTRDKQRFSSADAARMNRRFGPQRLTRDHPSFVIEAPPARAYEALLIAVQSLGAVEAEEPGHIVESQFGGANAGWCRLTLQPEGAATAVSIEFASRPGYPVTPIETIRDAVIAELNQIDWSAVNHSPPS